MAKVIQFHLPKSYSRTAFTQQITDRINSMMSWNKTNLSSIPPEWANESLRVVFDQTEKQAQKQGIFWSGNDIKLTFPETLDLEDDITVGEFIDERVNTLNELIEVSSSLVGSSLLSFVTTGFPELKPVDDKHPEG